MTAILGTLPFIATLWLLLVLGAAVLEESGAKIAAALKGERVQKHSRSVVVRRDRTKMRNAAASRAIEPLRAAA